ncbi:MAG: MBL fold metallo-hydrolase [Bryobacteraceae bacterium]|nr:MBL fold metallo-hydrolase [Bryobacteraceae bacterium]
MIQPVRKGQDLVREIDATPALTPTLWWLGQSGFVVKYHEIVFYIDPYLSEQQTAKYRNTEQPRVRLMAAPLRGWQVRNADMILATHRHGTHLDAASILSMLKGSRRARLVLPKSAAGYANGQGIDYLRMTTTDEDLPIDYSKNGQHCRIVPVASAHETVDERPLEGHPYLGYVIRFDDKWAIYHSGDCVPYPGLVERLKPQHVNVALLPINGRDPRRGTAGNFTVEEAAQLADDIGAEWLVPMHYGMFEHDTVDIQRFIDHMLFSRPSQRFKVFACGEGWAVPEE